MVDNPQTLLFCESDQPFQGSYRVSGGYTFPWKLQVSGVYQSIPPDSFQPTYAVTSTSPGITLGRPIVTGTDTVPVVAPYTFFTDRVNQVDLRVTKTIQVEKYRIELMADFYNVFNISPVLTRNAAIGPVVLYTDFDPAVRVPEARCAIHVLVEEVTTMMRSTTIPCPAGSSLRALFPATVFAQTSAPSFGKDIAPILYAKCAMCHQGRRGGADVAHVVQRSAALGPRDQDQGRLSPDATVVRRGRAWQMA